MTTRRVAFPQSTAVDFAEYDEAAATLTICFRSGAVHCFYMVPRRVFDGLVQAPSAGRFFAAEVRNRFNSDRK